MAPTPAKFRLHLNPSGNAVPASSIDKSIPEQENIPQSDDRPFQPAARKSPLSPSRLAIVQATRQGSAKKSTAAATSPTRKGSASSNTEPLVRTTPRSAYFKVRNEETTQENSPPTPTQKSQKQEAQPQIDLVSFTKSFHF